MLKMSLLIISLSILSCAHLPDHPAVWQCGYTVKFNKFRCVNVKTKQAINLKRDDPRMEGAQCLSVNDYERMEAWLQQVKEIAERRCE